MEDELHLPEQVYGLWIALLKELQYIVILIIKTYMK